MPNPLDPTTITKYSNQLFIPPVYVPTVIKDQISGEAINQNFIVTISQFTQQILPVSDGLPATTVWGYESTVRDSQTGTIIQNFMSTPGPTFEATRHIPINVQWINNLTGAYSLAVDPTIHWANPNNMPTPSSPFNSFPPGYAEAQSPVPVVTHLHGGETEPSSDGYPEAWFTTGEAITGPAFIKSLYQYVNSQQSTTLWYHDHALGLTRLNAYMGLSGFYILRDPNNPLDGVNSVLPKGQYEVPLSIQDRSFLDDGSLAFPDTGDNPNVHPYWMPEFFGDTIMVNGRVWPNLDVEPRQYRFRILNGSNARFYTLMFSTQNQTFSDQIPFIQIGTDGGYLPKPVQLVSLTLAPAERADILVDFPQFAPGTQLYLLNSADAPFPDGTPSDINTVGQIMQFTVVSAPVVIPSPLPKVLNIISPLKSSKIRTLTLYEILDPTTFTPLEILLDGQMWDAPVSELPLVGTTEDWQIVNLTGDTHPIHLHLIQFQLVSRQDFLVDQYTSDWLTLNNAPPIPFNQPTKVLLVEPYLLNGPVNPPANENGWKDTIQANPGQVTTIRVRFAPQDVEVSSPGINLFPFNPAAEPGYVWHCHIIDHEDNEMMRPYKVLNPLNDP
jgi:FtsP/CotA-like multicopper oxidase with cupredoxin domain